jgi:hypothetical protein
VTPPSRLTIGYLPRRLNLSGFSDLKFTDDLTETLVRRAFLATEDSTGYTPLKGSSIVLKDCTFTVFDDASKNDRVRLAIFGLLASDHRRSGVFCTNTGGVGKEDPGHEVTYFDPPARFSLARTCLRFEAVRCTGIDNFIKCLQHVPSVTFSMCCSVGETDLCVLGSCHSVSVDTCTGAGFRAAIHTLSAVTCLSIRNTAQTKFDDLEDHNLILSTTVHLSGADPSADRDSFLPFGLWGYGHFIGMWKTLELIGCDGVSAISVDKRNIQSLVVDDCPGLVDIYDWGFSCRTIPILSLSHCEDLERCDLFPATNTSIFNCRKLGVTPEARGIGAKTRICINNNVRLGTIEVDRWMAFAPKEILRTGMVHSNLANVYTPEPPRRSFKYHTLARSRTNDGRYLRVTDVLASGGYRCNIDTIMKICTSLEKHTYDILGPRAVPALAKRLRDDDIDLNDDDETQDNSTVPDIVISIERIAKRPRTVQDEDNDDDDDDDDDDDEVIEISSDEEDVYFAIHNDD